VRVFPKNETPQTNRNENPVNNNPVTRPQVREDIRSSNNRRTFPNSTPRVNTDQPENRPPSVTNPRTNTRQSNPQNNPAREFNNSPSTNVNRNSDARPNSRNFDSRIKTQEPRTTSPQPQSRSLQPQGSVRQRSSEIRRFNPAQHIERRPQAKQETKE
jgi:hypothetical protein